MKGIPSQGHSNVLITGMTSTCLACGHVWDTNDAKPPECVLITRVEFVDCMRSLKETGFGQVAIDTWRKYGFKAVREVEPSFFRSILDDIDKANVQAVLRWPPRYARKPELPPMPKAYKVGSKLSPPTKAEDRRVAMPRELGMGYGPNADVIHQMRVLCDDLEASEKKPLRDAGTRTQFAELFRALIGRLK